jgi:hypothetical protein
VFLITPKRSAADCAPVHEESPHFPQDRVSSKLEGAWWRRTLVPTTEGFGTISTRSRPDDPSALEAERNLLAHRIAVLREAIAVLERGEPLRADAAARLAMYRKNEARLGEEMRKVEHDLVRREWLRDGDDDSDARSDIAADLLERLSADTAREAGR